MQRAQSPAARWAACLVGALVVSCLGASDAFAQAWVPPAHVGAVSVVYQHIDNTGHRALDGSLITGFDSASQGVFLNLDYAVTDRVSLSFGLPYIASKYIGPEPSFFGLPIDDCLCWNHAFQDFGATVRYNFANGAFALSPSVAFGFPSHNYDYLGEAVVGRNLNELRLAVDVGQRLDSISDRLSISGNYTFAFVEKVIGLQNNRSNAFVEASIILSRKMSSRIGLSWQRSHGGLRSTEFVTDEQIFQYDRIVKDNNVHITGGLSYSLPKLDLFAAYTHYASGNDTHAGRAISVGVSWPFER
jgi:hypothetical protein